MTQDSATRTRLGIQGPVVGWQDPWAGPASDAIMRTGTGRLVDSQDGYVSPGAFLGLLKELASDFYVHHVMPDATGTEQMLHDVSTHGIDIVLGNEYGNINGPHTPGTNRYDVPYDTARKAQQTGRLIGLLYDEPEHLQINASQYRKADFSPHFASVAGLASDAAEERIVAAVKDLVDGYGQALKEPGTGPVPLVAEHVFPVMFHTLARGGITPCPKVMKESFQPLQLATALGAAVQHRRDFWICADLWGPDIGPWFTRAPGFPGHSPQEYASALRMAYLFAPTHLFTENVDALARYRGGSFELSEFGEEWKRFATDFVPAHRQHWTFRDVRPQTVLIHAEDSNFGTGVRPFGDPDGCVAQASWSVFDAWHALSHGSIPRTGSCMHAPGFESPPRCLLDKTPRESFPLGSGVTAGAAGTTTHPLFHPLKDVVVFDETVTAERLGDPSLIVVAGTRLPERTLRLVRSAAERGATVVIARWLTTEAWSENRRVGAGSWVVTNDIAEDGDVQTALKPHIGNPDLWTQTFGTTQLRITPADHLGTTLEFEVRQAP